jgi:hypothetical protein
MTRMSLVALLQEHDELTHSLPKLVQAGAYAEAAYITAIMQTDLAEVGYVAPGSIWPRPGEAPPVGWSLYEAAVRWSKGGFQT